MTKSLLLKSLAWFLFLIPAPVLMVGIVNDFSREIRQFGLSTIIGLLFFFIFVILEGLAISIGTACLEFANRKNAERI